MLLSESEKARILRQMILDIVIDTINKRTGGATKYINQRDEEFILSYFEKANEYINLLKKFNRSSVFLSNFFEVPEKISLFSIFCEFSAPQLLKPGSESDLKKILKSIYVSKTGVSYIGEKKLQGEYKAGKEGGSGGGLGEITKVTVSDIIISIKEKYPITEEEAIVINEVCEEKILDPEIRNIVDKHKNDETFLLDHYRKDVRKSIEGSYTIRSLFDCLVDEKYIDPGSIFDIMSHMVIQITKDECA